MERLLAEHGPYFLSNETTTLEKNPYAWNKLANVVYIESPTFVGFSFHTEGDSGVWNDETHFFEKFPQFRNHSVFVTGESYAGIYVPMLAERIIDGQKEFPINSSDELDAQSLDEFARGHGMAGSFQSEVPNVYDIYRDCEVPQSVLNLQSLLGRVAQRKLSDGNLPFCNPPFGPYLTKPEVRRALQIPDHLVSWELCTGGLYDRASDHNVHPQVTKILDSNVRVLLYFGDTDGACNFLGGHL